MEEERGSGHGNNNAVGLAGRLERADDAVAFGDGGIDWHQIVIVQVDAPRAHLRQHGDNINWGNMRAHSVAKRVASAVADRPQAEGELVFRTGLIIAVTCHNVFSMPPQQSI